MNLATIYVFLDLLFVLHKHFSDLLGLISVSGIINGLQTQISPLV
jgi:hypothetical protein